jgi:hypothetical protein
MELMTAHSAKEARLVYRFARAPATLFSVRVLTKKWKNKVAYKGAIKKASQEEPVRPHV